MFFSKAYSFTGEYAIFIPLPFGLSGFVTTPIILNPASYILFNDSCAKSGVPINKIFNILISFYLIYMLANCYYCSGFTISKVPGSILSTNKIPSKWSVSWQIACANNSLAFIFCFLPFTS